MQGVIGYLFWLKKGPKPFTWLEKYESYWMLLLSWYLFSLKLALAGFWL